MSSTKPFIIHPGHGGLLGAAEMLRRQSTGEQNARIQKWLRERVPVTGMRGGPPPDIVDIVIPAADLIFDPSDPAAVFGWSSGQVLPFPGANTWFPTGPDADGVRKLDYRNVVGSTGTYFVTGGGTGGLPIEGDDFFAFNIPSGAGDSWNANQQMSDYIADEGVTSPEFTWFVVVRKPIRRAAAGVADFGAILGTRRTISPVGGYALFCLSQPNTTVWSPHVSWVTQSDVVGFNITGNIDTPIISGSGSNGTWVVVGLQFDNDRVTLCSSQDFFDGVSFATVPGDRVKHRTDTGSGRFQIALDGSLAGGNDDNIAEVRYFDRRLTPTQFNLVMADMLVQYGIDPK